jgi:hypothetical protein
MNTTSRLLAAAGALLLGGCLPGPWDYTPSGKPAFRGVTMYAYAVAGRPVEDACFEHLLPLDEAASDSRAWYDSATVTVAGNFSTGNNQVLTLTPKPLPVNCFAGPSSALFLEGQSYVITASFVWDSAGTTARSLLTATARIPAGFSVRDTAYAPAYALTGVGSSPLNPAGLFPVPYRNGDTVYYLPAKKIGDFNLSELSHFFLARYGDDVKAVLMTRRFDSTEAKPETSFDSIAGFVPSLSDFYMVGTINRLILYPSVPTPGGRNLLDSMGMVNAWFWTGRNRIYFYGAEGIYADYHAALEESYENTKVRLPTNVTGGRGFFAGMGVDSFTVNIKLDGFTQAFAYNRTRVAACSEEGWYDSRECIGYYREFCRDTLWSVATCKREAAYTSLDPVESLMLPDSVQDSLAVWAEKDSTLMREAAGRYCIDNNYPAGVAECAPVKSQCEDGPPGNVCQKILWTRCMIGYWNLPACTEGIKSYCSVNRKVAKTLCRDVPNP